MERLSKLKLPKSAVPLQEREMKATRGGYGPSGCHPAMCDSGEMCIGTQTWREGTCVEAAGMCICATGA